MKVTGFVKVKKNGSLSITKYKPDVSSDEVVTQLNFDIPDALFTTPVHEANINILPPTGKAPMVTIDTTVIADWIDKA